MTNVRTTIKPMLAEQAPIPEVNDPGKIWEVKYDGARILPHVDRLSGYYLQARSGSNKTETFPELRLETKLPAILDGEIVGANGGSFQDTIQRRINRTREISIAAKTNPAKFVAFDLLEIDGKNIEHLPLLERKNLLSKVLVETENVEIASYTEDALDLWNNVIIPGSLEGMVGKLKTGKYQRDARTWEKVKAWKRNYGRFGSTGETFLVVGYTQGTGWRESTFGAMVLGRLETDGSLTYVGEVGTGMNTSDIAGLMSMFSTAGVFCPWPVEPEPATWVKPFAVKIQYLEYTNEGVMRFPSFKGVV